tara:strand:+ start:1131 stop:3110 length:1980 start_codon:yes stop_codon:yes gene_type:complete
MKRMLVNATQPEEVRIAITDGNTLFDLDIENVAEVRRKGNIYKGKISRIEPSLGAAFVDFGAERHGFLPFKELAPQYLPKDKKSKERISIKDCLTKDQEIIVQVEKDERGNKGAALTTLISIAGRFLVLMPNNPRASGISRRLNPDQREILKKKITDLNAPEGMGVIVRTAGEGRDQDDLKWDLSYLLNVWEAILEANALKSAPFLIFKESDILVRTLRDYLKEDVDEIWIDTKEAYEQAEEFISSIMPEQLKILNKYENTLPLFTRYQIESQIETAYQREVRLSSGGAIVIDDTEALVAIDINSSQATQGKDIEETATNTNLEASREIARQFRLRDIGGLVVIDFIDMMKIENKRAVEDEMRKALSVDRARVQIGRISRFGLLELSRQRLRSSLSERWTQDVNTLSTSVLRLLEEETSKSNTSEVRAVVSPDMSSLLLNERRIRLNDIEARSGVKVVVISDATRPDSRFEVIRIKDGKVQDPNKNESSISAAEQFERKSKKIKKPQEDPAVKIMPSSRPKKSLFTRITSLFKSTSSSNKDIKNQKKLPSKRKSQPKHNKNQNRSNKKFDNKNKNFQKNKSKKESFTKPKKNLANKDNKNIVEKSKNFEKKKDFPSSEIAPKKLSRPKRPEVLNVENEVKSSKKININERASNDPRNKN